MPWYCYISGDPANPSSYIYCGNTPNCCNCSMEGPKLCGIYACYNLTNTQVPCTITASCYADIKAAIENEVSRGCAYVKRE